MTTPVARAERARSRPQVRLHELTNARLGEWRRYLFAFAVVALAAAFRVWPLQAFGARLAWLTFYPAVMIAAAYGGLVPGLVATGLSPIFVAKVLPAFIDVRFFRDDADIVGVAIFMATGVLVSSVAEAMHRARARTQIANEALSAANRDLERTAARLDAANRELESFSYSVAHDLRAPLRSIDGFSQALLEDYDAKLDEDGRKYLRFVRESAQRMAELIDDLLALSRVTRAEFHREPVDLSGLAQSAIERLQRAHPERKVEVVIAPGVRGAGDARLLGVVLENLLSNAWKFTGKKDPARIEFGETAKDAARAFFVRDNGAGFDMAYANKLFGVFQRLHPASEFEGTGVGLATVQRVVARHGGRVWAEAALDQGATFYFTLDEKGSDA